MSIRKRGDGRWQIELRGAKDPATGKYRRYAFTVDGSKRDAERLEAVRRAEINALAARWVEPSRETLGRYLSRWLDDRLTPGTPKPIRPTTARSYRGLIDTHLVPALGSVPLDELSPAMVQNALDSMGRKKGPNGRAISPRTVGYCRTVLRMALADAARLGIVAQNVVDRTRAPKAAHRKVTSFTVEEVQALFVAGDRSRYGPLIRFLATTGLRRGEALGLKWTDITAAGTVTVRRTVIESGARVYVQDDAKTRAGLRSLTLPETARDALRRQRRAQVEDKKRCLAAGRPYTDGGWVFAAENGALCWPRNANRAYTAARKAAGVPALPLHALRHTAVSLMLAAGVKLEVISKIVGHKNWSLTLDTYSDLLPEAGAGAAELLDRFLAGNRL